MLICVPYRRRRRYLAEADFVSAIAPTGDFAKISQQQYGLLFRIADQRKRGKVSWEDFLYFETLLQKPDAEFDVSRARLVTSSPTALTCLCFPLDRVQIFRPRWQRRRVVRGVQARLLGEPGSERNPVQFRHGLDQAVSRQSGRRTCSGLQVRAACSALTRLPLTCVSLLQRVHPVDEGSARRASAASIPLFRQR